jgi:hypothetical protein
MPDFNAIWQQYQPILQQYRDDISARSQDLTNMQASGNTFEDRLKERLKSVKSIQEPAIQARKVALEGAMNAPQQAREVFSDIKNPLAREQAGQPMVSRAVADADMAANRLKQIQTPAPELIQSATNARAAEQARVQGMLQAAQDRYTMLRDEFQTGYQMASDEWDRNMQEQQFAFQKQQANRGSGSAAKEKVDYGALEKKKLEAANIMRQQQEGYTTPTGTVRSGEVGMDLPPSMQPAALPSLYEGLNESTGAGLSGYIDYLRELAGATQPKSTSDLIKLMEAQGQSGQSETLRELQTDFKAGMPLDQAYVLYSDLDRNLVKAMWDAS